MHVYACIRGKEKNLAMIRKGRILIFGVWGVGVGGAREIIGECGGEGSGSMR